jgi:hypothetical protein
MMPLEQKQNIPSLLNFPWNREGSPHPLSPLIFVGVEMVPLEQKQNIPSLLKFPWNREDYPILSPLIFVGSEMVPPRTSRVTLVHLVVIVL